nr:serine hydrolase [Allomuricauda sp.]
MPTSHLKYLFLSLCIITFISSCKQPSKSTNPSETPTERSQFAFLKGSLEANGLEPNLIEDMEDSILADVYPNIHSVLILKNGQLVYENYYDGKDELWGKDLGVIEHHKDSLHDIRSVSKSIVATCIGIAIHQGKIDSIGQNVFDFFPEHTKYKEGLRSQLTIEHLLTMTSGMEWNENVPYTDPENSEIQMTSSGDPIQFVLSRPMVHVPGELWEYNGGTTQLLATIIERATNQNIHDFAVQHLFTPLEITTSTWTKFPGLELPAAASGLRLTSRDLLKFGMLYANNGLWNGKQILSEAWVKHSLQPKVWFGRNNNVGYGYQFWIFKGKTIHKGLNHFIPSAVGNGGQRIYLDLPNELIVVITAGNYNNWTLKKDSEALLVDFIYPALFNVGSPTNPENN